MDDLIFVEGEKSALYKHLDGNFSVASLSAVAALAPTFSRVMCDYLRDRITTNTAHIFPGTRLHAGRQPGIELGTRIFRVQYTPEPLVERDVLPFVILEHGGDGPMPGLYRVPNIIDLPNISQYKKISFSVDPALNFNEELLDTLSRGIFSAGYQWLSNKITFCIKLDTAKISTVLYDYMRSMLAERPELLSGFVFACLMDDKDFVILDEAFAQGALLLADQRAARFQRSKESLVLQLLGEVVSASESVITDACASPNDTIQIPLSAESQRYRGHEELFDSMAAVWGQEVTCQPIVRAGRLRLVSFYPSSAAAGLTPLVAVHSSALERLAMEQADLIHSHLNLLETVFGSHTPAPPAPPRTGRWNAFAEVFGNFSGAFAGRTIKTLNE